MSFESTSTAPTSRGRLLGAGLLVAGLTAGALLSPVGLAGAQDDDSAGDDASQSGNSIRHEHRQHRAEILESLGIDAGAIQAGVEADQSLAEIAAANGVSESELVAAIEADIATRLADAVESGRITQEQADEKATDLTERITERVNTPPSERPERSGRGHRGFRSGEVLQELGLTVEDLRTGRQAGQTLSEIAAANGVSESELVDALVAQATERAEAAVEDGRIDAATAAEKLDGIDERITERVNAAPGDRPERGQRGPRGQRQVGIGETTGSF